jgi:hypothetical protein
VKQDWERGLRHFEAAGSDPWQTLAAMESKPDKSSGDKQQLANRWSQAGNADRDGLKPLFHARAAYWSLQAYPDPWGRVDSWPLDQAKRYGPTLPELLRHTALGRGLAALTSVQALKATINDDFRNPNVGFRAQQRKDEKYDDAYKGDRYVMHSWFGAGQWHGWYAPGTYRNAACLTVGRALGQDRDGWAVRLAEATFGVRRNGEIQVVFQDPNQPRIVIPPHDVVNRGDGWNAVLVMRRGKELRLVVNGVEVCPPIELLQDVPAAALGIWTMQSEESQSGVQAEFRKIVVWPLD